MIYKEDPTKAGYLIFDRGEISTINLVPKGGPGLETIRDPRLQTRSDPNSPIPILDKTFTRLPHTLRLRGSEPTN